jgi:cob(I)alamin adenosyltransferase
MGNRLTKIYTRTGDQGTTGLGDGSRRSKNDPRVHCMGEVDELNACLGLALSLLDDGPVQQVLFAVQHDLFDIGAELAQPGKIMLDDDYVKSVESKADEFNAGLEPLREFILPGGSQAVAAIHLARTVCRRVERSLVRLAESEDVNPVTSRYINRLSDLLFIIGRAQSQTEDGGEVYWNSKYSRLNTGKD